MKQSIRFLNRFRPHLTAAALFALNVVSASLGVSFFVALVPVLVCLAYIFGLRQGKPPGYDRDILEYAAAGRGFSPEVHRSCTHPLL